jgi:hypothetical protein
MAARLRRGYSSGLAVPSWLQKRAPNVLLGLRSCCINITTSCSCRHMCAPWWVHNERMRCYDCPLDGRRARGAKRHQVRITCRRASFRILKRLMSSHPSRKIAVFNYKRALGKCLWMGASTNHGSNVSQSCGHNRHYSVTNVSIREQDCVILEKPDFLDHR